MCSVIPQKKLQPITLVKTMREITWAEAIEIAKRRRDNMNGAHLYVVFNGAKGDFSSLYGAGVIGRFMQDDDGDWFIDTGLTNAYLHDNATVWVG